MDYYKSILICGGDLRQKYLFEDMLKKGFKVSTFALNENGVNINDICKFDVLILPVPVSKDGEHLNTPLIKYKIKIEDVLSRTDYTQTILGGVCGGISDNIIDYYKNEDFQMQNAIPTAEGALQIAMENTEITINNSRCGVLGFGRIGKIMARMLKNMGADVTVFARNPKDISLAKALGYNAINIVDISNYIKKFDILFNTVPHRVIDCDALCNLKDNSVIIELASKPYGTDIERAEKLGKKVIVASALPGKVAPITAGKILSDVITDILMGLEV